MKVLFIGGSGVISSACSELCAQNGIDLTVLNRGQSFRKLPQKVNSIISDIRDIHQTKSALAGKYFDVVVDFIAYTREHVRADFGLFNNKTSQYIFISSASTYQKPPQRLPIRETEPLSNPYWEYSRNKIACEDFLMQKYQTDKFPVTIVRPSHTYDKTKIPLPGGATTLSRLIKRKQIVVHGDGTSLWTLTHHKDFAKDFIGLLGRSDAIGEAYHITSDESLTWNQITAIIADDVGVEPEIVHIPSEFIRHFDPEWGDGLLGDKAHSMIFDNSKIKNINPEFQARIHFSDGVREITDWYLSDQSRLAINTELDQRIDLIISQFNKGYTV